MNISINPPPANKRCECCGKSISELKPFGKAGDPLVGDFDGQILVKMFRSMAPHIKEFDEKIELLKTEEDWDKLDKEEADNLSFYDQLTNTIEASWECRDCICLDSDEEYFDIRSKTYSRLEGENVISKL